MTAGHAEFKTHILRREEKGLLGIPFKRLMGAGVIAAFVFMLLKLVIGGLAVPIAMLVFISGLILSGLRGGLPLYQRLYLKLRGHLILQAAQPSPSLLRPLAHLLHLPLELAILDSELLFAPALETPAMDFADLVMFATPHEAARDTGLVHVADPLVELPHLQEPA